MRRTGQGRLRRGGRGRTRPRTGRGENVAPQGRVEFQALPPEASAASSSTSPGAPGSRPGGGSAEGGGTATAPSRLRPATRHPTASGHPDHPGLRRGRGHGLRRLGRLRLGDRRLRHPRLCDPARHTGHTHRSRHEARHPATAAPARHRGPDRTRRPGPRGGVRPLVRARHGDLHQHGRHRGPFGHGHLRDAHHRRARHRLGHDHHHPAAARPDRRMARRRPRPTRSAWSPGGSPWACAWRPGTSRPPGADGPATACGTD